MTSRVAWWSLLGLALVPIVTSNFSVLAPLIPALANPVLPGQFALPRLVFFFALVAVSLLAWALDWARSHYPVKWHPALWFLLAFVILTIVSCFTSVDPSSSFFGLTGRRLGALVAVCGAVATFLAVQLVNGSVRVRTLTSAVVIVSAMQGLYGVLQALGLDPVSWGEQPFEAGRATGLLGNPNAFGALLGMTVPLGLGLALEAKTDKSRIWWWCANAAIGAGLLLAFTRAAWIGSVTGVFIVVMIARRCSTTLHRVDRWALTLIGGVMALVTLLSVLGKTHYSVLDRIASILQPTAGSALQRLGIWRAALDGIAERPWFGWGPNTFLYVWDRHVPAWSVTVFGADGAADSAHSLPLEIAAGMGIPATLMFYALGLIVVVSSARYAWPVEAKVPITWISWLGAITAYFVASMVSIPFMAGIALSAIGVGVLLAPFAVRIEMRQAARSAMALLLAVLAVGCAVPLAMLTGADYHYGRALIATSADSVVAHMDSATRLAPWDHYYRARSGDLRWDTIRSNLDAVYADQASADPKVVAWLDATLARAQDDYDAALADVPYDYWAASGLVAVLYERGKLGMPSAYLRSAIAAERAERYLDTPQLDLLRAQSLIASGREEQALAFVRQLKKEWPGWQPPIDLERQLLAESDNP